MARVRRYGGGGDAGGGRGRGLRPQPHALRSRRPPPRRAGRGGDLHGRRHWRGARLRGAPRARRLRPCVQRRARLSRRRHRVVAAARAPSIRVERMTPDLSVELGNARLRGPVLAASGTFGYGTEVPLLERRALGAMVSKGIFLRPRAGTPPPRIVETPSGMLNAIRLQGPSVHALIRDYAPQSAEWDFPVFVNINGESAAEYGDLAARLDGVPAVAGFEINISSPTVDQVALYFANDPPPSPPV